MRAAVFAGIGLPLVMAHRPDPNMPAALLPLSGAGAGLEAGALIEPIAIALHAINNSGFHEGQRVLGLGAGPIGLGVAWWARNFGAWEPSQTFPASDEGGCNKDDLHAKRGCQASPNGIC